MKKTIVVNKNKSEYDVYIGRGSIFGNPYIIGRDGTREEVIKKYRKWFYNKLRSPKFQFEINKLSGKRLGCFCKPLDCHGDVIANYLNKKL